DPRFGEDLDRRGEKGDVSERHHLHGDRDLAPARDVPRKAELNAEAPRPVRRVPDFVLARAPGPQLVELSHAAVELFLQHFDRRDVLRGEAYVLLDHNELTLRRRLFDPLEEAERRP